MHSQPKTRERCTCLCASKDASECNHLLSLSSTFCLNRHFLFLPSVDQPLLSLSISVNSFTFSHFLPLPHSSTLMTASLDAQVVNCLKPKDEATGETFFFHLFFVNLSSLSTFSIHSLIHSLAFLIYSTIQFSSLPLSLLTQLVHSIHFHLSTMVSARAHTYFVSLSLSYTHKATLSSSHYYASLFYMQLQLYCSLSLSPPPPLPSLIYFTQYTW